MMDTLTPDTRRLVIQYAAKERISFEVALECLVLDGFKAFCEQTPSFKPLVHKPVEKRLEKSVN